LTTSPKSPHHEERLLARFIRQVGERNDTPSLIMTIAADTDYLRLCHLIVDQSTQTNPKFFKTLKTVCRDHGWRLSGLQAKLTPAAKALGLMTSTNSATDYYRLLGVRSHANAQEIGKAFRRKAARVHPDANANPTGSSRLFVELNDAYQTLRDPLLRQHYDINRQQPNRWREQPGSSRKADSRPAIQLSYLFGLLFIFIFLFLVLDAIVFQK
jgi:hypothetical protein